MGCRGGRLTYRPERTMGPKDEVKRLASKSKADQSILISAVLPASPMHKSKSALVSELLLVPRRTSNMQRKKIYGWETVKT